MPTMKKKFILAAIVLSSALLSTGTASAATWIDRYTSGIRNWVSLAASSDGSRLVAGDTTGLAYIYTSADAGATWTARPSAGSRTWVGMTSSSDGMKLAAVATGSNAYTSTDGGATWTTRTVPGASHLQGIASSSDGTKLAVVDGGSSTGTIYTSTNGGATWTARPSAGTRTWSSIASSSDGMRLAAVAKSNGVFTSTDGGATWTSRTITAAHSSNGFFTITSSANGMKLAVGDYSYGYIYTSTDGGLTWTQRTGAGGRNWLGLSYSGDGTDLAAADHFGLIYTSTNDGATWTTETGAGTHDWSALAHSYDGSFIAAGPLAGNIWTTGVVSTGGITPPSVTTTAATSVGTVTASINGNLTSLGSASSLTALGFRWGTTTAYGTTAVVSTTGVTTGPFTYALSGLTCGTTYHYQAFATNSAGTASGSDMVFTTLPCTTAITVPTVITNAATAIGTTTATIHGTLVSNGGSPTLTVGFNRGATTAMSLGSSLPGAFPPGPFYVALTGLTCNTTYYFQALSNNSVGYGYGSMLSFTTLPCTVVTVLPAVTTVSATAITPTTATFNGAITAVSPNASLVGFGYNTSVTTTTGSDPSVTTAGSFGAGPFSINITGLTCATTYHFRAYATNTVGTGWGSDLPFTTAPCPVSIPAVSTDPAGSITGSGAAITGTVLSLGSATTAAVGFDYGPTPSYGTTVAVGGMTTLTPFGTILSGLPCGTTYHYRAYLTTVGTVYGIDRTFTTLPCPAGAPTVVTNPATSITATSAVLSGTVTAMGPGATSITNRTFTSTTGTVTPSVAVVTSIPSTFTFPVTGLTCATTYTYTAQATNNAALTGMGATVSFTTLPCPVGTPIVITDAATSITSSSAVLNGRVTALGTGAISITSRSFTGTFGPTATLSGTITTMPNSFSFTATGLACGAFYTFTARATNNGSATGTGATLSFSTLACPAGAPTVVTNPATSVTSNSAVLSGTVTAFGAGSTTITSRTFTSTTGAVTPSSFTVTTLPSTFTFLASGLACSTTYTYTARATNGGGTTGSGSPVSFTTLACPTAATVVTVSSSSVGSTSAVLTGNITTLGSGGSATDRGFLYSTVPTSASSLFTTQSGTWSTGSYSHSVTSLTPCTTYYYQAYMSQGGAVTYGPPDLTFTTTCPPGLPSVITTAVGTVTTSTAVINGQVTGLGGAGVSVTPGFTVSGGSLGTVTPSTISTAGTSFSATLSGLTCATTYTYTARATNSAGTAVAPSSVTFTTPSCSVVPPVVTTNTPTIVGTSVTFSGVLTSAGTTSTGVTGGPLTSLTGFDYGFSPSGAPTTVNFSGSYAYAVGSPFTTTVSTLSCGFTYYVRAHGTNLAGTDSGSDMTFTIPCPVTPPSVITTAVGTVTTSTAVINGQVTGLGGTGVSVTPGFNIPAGTSLGIVSPATISSAGTNFSATLSGLFCNTSYTYTAKATNSAGTTVAPSSVTFTTLPCNPSVTTNPATPVNPWTSTGAILRGTLGSLGAGATWANVGFHWGVTTAYGNTITTVFPANPRTATGSFVGQIPSSMLAGLTCNDPWHFEAFAVNANGTTITGGDMPFCPTI